METPEQLTAPTGFEDVPAIMSPRQLSKVLDVGIRTLERWREKKEGPAFNQPKGSRVIRYYRRDLLAWLENEQAPGPETDC